MEKKKTKKKQQKKKKNSSFLYGMEREAINPYFLNSFIYLFSFIILHFLKVTKREINDTKKYLLFRFLLFDLPVWEMHKFPPIINSRPATYSAYKWKTHADFKIGCLFFMANWDCSFVLFYVYLLLLSFAFWC